MHLIDGICSQRHLPSEDYSTMKSTHAALRLMQVPFRNTRRVDEFSRAFRMATPHELPTLYASFVQFVATDAKAVFTLAQLTGNEHMKRACGRSEAYYARASHLKKHPTEEGVWELAIEGMLFVLDIHVYIQVWRGNMKTYDRGIESGQTDYELGLFEEHLATTDAFRGSLQKLRQGETLPDDETRKLMLWQAGRQRVLLHRYLRQILDNLRK